MGPQHEQDHRHHYTRVLDPERPSFRACACGDWCQCTPMRVRGVPMLPPAPARKALR